MEHFDTVRSLTPLRRDWRIRVRVIHKWRAATINQLHVIFADNRGEKIEAIANHPSRDVWDAQLHEGDWVTVENFRVVPVRRGQYLVHPTMHRFHIQVEQGSGVDTVIRNVWPSQDPDMFYDFCNGYRILHDGYARGVSVDLVGVIQRVGRMVEVPNCDYEQNLGHRLNFIRFYLTDAFNATLECVAHGAFARYVERMWEVTAEEQPLCIFRFGRIYRHHEPTVPVARTVVATTIFSHLLLDDDVPDIEEVKHVREVFPSSSLQ